MQLLQLLIEATFKIIQIEEQLFEEIAKIGGVSDVSHMKAYRALIGDVSVARAFLACPIDRRKLWLSVKFGPTFFDA